MQRDEPASMGYIIVRSIRQETDISKAISMSDQADQQR